ncbi:MAG: hypothetical protein ABI577_12625 [bacterium]
MRNENGLEVDREALDRLLGTSDLITIGFTLFPERLLIDTRSNKTDGQYAAMVEPVASVQERYLWLGKHRSSFGAPEGFAFFIWPHTVRGLIERDALAVLKTRLDPAAREALDEAIVVAVELERLAMIEAVKGSERWPAMWEKPAA